MWPTPVRCPTDIPQHHSHLWYCLPERSEGDAWSGCAGLWLRCARGCARGGKIAFRSTDTAGPWPAAVPTNRRRQGVPALLPAAVPHRPHRMDHELRRASEARSDHGLAGGTGSDSTSPFSPPQQRRLKTMGFGIGQLGGWGVCWTGGLSSAVESAHAATCAAITTRSGGDSLLSFLVALKCAALMAG